LIAIAASMSALAVVASLALDKRLADPDGFLGPAWVRLPLLLLGALAADVLPRTVWASRIRPGRMVPLMKERLKSHWTGDRVRLVFLGVACFYLTYVSYRNLKSFLPSILGEQIYDRELRLIDRTLFLGHDPGVLLHNMLGTSLSAHMLSSIYLWFLPLVPLALTAWLVWSRNIGFGYWFVIAQCIAWTLGTASYYALPTLGPGFEYPWLFDSLDTTASSRVMEALQYGRQDVNHTALEGAVQSVAGFASLHCAITLLVAMMAQVTLRSKLVHWILWVNFGMTIIATLYFGWHYVADDVAGIVIALVAFYLGGLASGQHFERYREAPDPEASEPTAPSKPSRAPL
jgi:PAP2 superfamily